MLKIGQEQKVFTGQRTVYSGRGRSQRRKDRHTNTIYKYGVELQIQKNKSLTSNLGALYLVNLITLPMFSPISR